MMKYKPSQAYYKEFTTARFSTGAAYDATGTPVATANKNGTDDGAFSLTVTNIDTGRNKITGTVPSGYADGDIVNVTVAATVDGVAAKAVVDTFLVVTSREADIYARVGAPAGASVSADVAAVKSDSAAILLDTGTDGVVVAGASKTGYSLTQSFPTNFAALSITAGGLVDITQAAADKVWSTAARTLTGFGSLAADVWGYASRLLTAGTNIALAKGTGVTGFNDIAAADVWSVATRALTDKAGFELSAAGVDAILDEVVEGGLTMRQILRISLAALAGISSGGGTATIIFKGVDGVTTRITATVDADGNRTAITVNGA